MEEGAVHLFAGWESYYVIIGSSAAALTGLQFVIMALVAESDRPGGPQEIAAFGSPTVVHFCSALLISGVFTAPWPSLSGPGHGAFLAGLAGLAYTAIVFRRALRQTGYQPVFEDWLWHTMLPAVAYVMLLVSGILLVHEAAPFFVGASVLLLVFIGIHNAWDTVTYVALNQKKFLQERSEKAASAPPAETAPAKSDPGGSMPSSPG